MTEIRIIVVCCVLFGYSSARHVTKTLSADNGGKWGNWNQQQFCPPGTYAHGYKMKIEGNQGRGDDTSLNGIQLICQGGSTIASGVGRWGNWGSASYCTSGDAFVAFKLQVEPYQGANNDDTAANFVKFTCTTYSSQGYRNIDNVSVPPGKGFWGSYGTVLSICAPGSAICGLETRIEEPQGRGDDTALNDVRFFCCDD